MNLSVSEFNSSTKISSTSVNSGTGTTEVMEELVSSELDGILLAPEIESPSINLEWIVGDRIRERRFPN